MKWDLGPSWIKKPQSSCRQLSTTLEILKSTVLEHSIHLDYEYKQRRQDQHELTVFQANKRIEICKQLLQNSVGIRYWKKIVTCDQKWLCLRNPENRRQSVLQIRQLVQEV